MTDNNKDRRWVSENAGNVLCARVAKEVYDYFNPRPATAKAAAGK